MVRRQRAGSQKAWATTQVLPLRSWEALDKLRRHPWLQLHTGICTNKICCKVVVSQAARSYPPKPLIRHCHKVTESFLEPWSATADPPGYEVKP